MDILSSLYINGTTLEVYNDHVNTNDVTAGVDNNYNNYNIDNTAYEDGTNNKGWHQRQSKQKKGARYPPTPNTNNPLKNYEQETMDNKSVDETPGMGASEET